MPEGDAVRITANRLKLALAGRPLTVAELRWPGLSTARLVGTTILDVATAAKHLLLRLDNQWTLHTHLRMDGRFVVRSVNDPGPRGRPDPRRSPDARLVLATADHWAVGLRLGMLDLVRTTDEFRLIGHLGPDLLASDFDLEAAAARLAVSAPISQVLLDQTTVAGIGTFWAAESLFVHRLDPWQDADQLDAEVRLRLLGWTRRLMLASVAQGLQTSTGSRRPGETSYVHARAGRPCRRCGTRIEVAVTGPPTRERPIFFCPRCQQGR